MKFAEDVFLKCKNDKTAIILVTFIQMHTVAH